MSFFRSIKALPNDPILQLPIAFAADPRPEKVNLGIGSYRDSEGRSLILDCVRTAQKQLIESQKDKEYLPIEGDPLLIKAATELLLGSALLATYSGGIFGAQTPGGTPALRLGGDFLAEETSNSIYIPEPSWPNHKMIFTRSRMAVNTYRYYDAKNFQCDFTGMCEDLVNMPKGSTILLQACCHNPTGIDLSQEQWKKLSALIKKQKIIPFFDFAYQGFASSVEEDAWPIRHFAAEGHEMLVSVSYSKNFGLYGERAGFFAFLSESKEIAARSATHIRQIIRNNYSTPPRHGAQIISLILNTPALKTEWLHELAAMQDRIALMRRTFVGGLQVANSQRDWNFLRHQKGFFSFCGLNPAQVQLLQGKYAIHMPADGRINAAGLNPHNMEYVVNAIADASKL